MLPTVPPASKHDVLDTETDAPRPDDPKSKLDTPLRINLWLVRDVTHDVPGDWMLDRVELNTEKLRSEYRFKHQKAVAKSLAEQLWDGIKNNLPTENQDRFVTSPDFFIDLGTITLSRMRVNCNRKLPGPQRALISFRRTVGTIDGLFRPGCAPDPMSEVRADLATRTLVDLVVPLTNLVDTILPDDNAEALERVNACLANLRHARHELDFYALLLSRYIAQTEKAQSTVGASASVMVTNEPRERPAVSWPERQRMAEPSEPAKQLSKVDARQR